MTNKIRKVSIVIPSWNSENQLKANLASVLEAADRLNAEVIIVDDASTDGTAKYLAKEGGNISLYANASNQGYGYSVNRGVSLAKGDVIILLNTDVSPSIDCFEKAVARFADPFLFAVTFNSGEGWAGGKWEKGMLHHYKVEPDASNKNTDNFSIFASGGQAAFSRNKWLELGGMDLLYKPFYWEDVDMGYRAWKRGWQIIWDPKCKCVHDHQKSVIAANFTPELIKATAQRNQFLFIWKNIHSPKLMLSHLLRIPLYIKSYPSAFFQALLLLPKALTGRVIEKSKSVKSDQEILSIWQNQ